MRTPRRSERYPSLVRIDTINGASADAVSDGARYEDLPVDYPSERLALGSEDPTLEAIEWLTPLGRGSRAVIVGRRARRQDRDAAPPARDALARPATDLELTRRARRRAARGDRATGRRAPSPPVAALSFAASADAQGQAVERALDAAKRVAARGGNALVLIDSLDGLHPHAARKALAAARNLRDGGSLTVIATATRPLGGETTVIALDVALTSTGRQPILDLLASGTLQARAARRRGRRRGDHQGPRGGDRGCAAVASVRLPGQRRVGDAAPGGLGRQLDRLAAAAELGSAGCT